jgi:hypothetical protein
MKARIPKIVFCKAITTDTQTNWDNAYDQVFSEAFKRLENELKNEKVIHTSPT